jgi:hypothetical protein
LIFELHDGTLALRSDRLLKVWPNFGTSLAASFAGKTRLQIRRPDLIRPLNRADRDRVAAMTVRAIDQQTANAHLAHLGRM